MSRVRIKNRARVKDRVRVMIRNSQHARRVSVGKGLRIENAAGATGGGGNSPELCASFFSVAVGCADSYGEDEGGTGGSVWMKMHLF